MKAPLRISSTEEVAGLLRAGQVKLFSWHKAAYLQLKAIAWWSWQYTVFWAMQ
jgi:hypothetical protein